MIANIGIWQIDRESRKPTKLHPAKQVDTEEMLEDILTTNPGMLMRGLKLVGRQVEVATGYLDLLGIDDKGRLTVFELKREKLTRKAVAQVLDYGSYLESLSESELATLISEESGKNGIDEITDFNEWYASQWEDALKPVQMVLVGLGADEHARRMVDYLAKRGIDIEIISFHGYAHDNAILLARQADDSSIKTGPNKTPAELKQELQRKANDYGVANLWKDTTNSLNYSVKSYPTKSGITYCQRTIILPENAHVRASHFIRLKEHGKVQITFSPGTVDLCRERFEQLKHEIQIDPEPPRNVPATRDEPNQWFCRLDEESWQKHKERLIEFVQAMEKAFADEYRRAMSEEMEENEAS